MGDLDPRGRDKENPPPGLIPTVCMGCGGEKLVYTGRMAIGPIRGRDVEPGEVVTIQGGAKCRICAGTGWTWATEARPKA